MGAGTDTALTAAGWWPTGAETRKATAATAATAAETMSELVFFMVLTPNVEN